MVISSPHPRTRGFSLTEVLVVMAVIGILFGIAAFSLRGLDNPLQNGLAQMSGVLKQTRAAALSTTSAYRLELSPSKATLTASSATSCGAAATAWTVQPNITLTLPNKVTVSGVSGGTWPVCFTSRGLSTQNLKFTLTDDRNRTGTVEVLLGGGAKVAP